MSDDPWPEVPDAEWIYPTGSPFWLSLPELEVGSHHIVFTLSEDDEFRLYLDGEAVS